MRQIFTKLILTSAFPLVAFGQVSTTPENRKVVIEEFTGVNCVYCPSGHVIANQIVNSNPGNAFVINIHQGGFAVPSGSQPDFRTPFGNAIANQSGLNGYPAATVNRHVFPGMSMTSGSTAMGRGNWAAASNQILAMPSYLNMYATAEIDVNTREITVNVEAYYTGNSPHATNKLNVVLLQNNTRGPQIGGNQGNNYNHMHRLVYMITGQWGDEITPTTQGSHINKTYTYTIPEAYNNIPADLAEMEVIVFMTETNQEIISGNKSLITYAGIPTANDLAVNSIKQVGKQCTENITLETEIQNMGQNPITSAVITYEINGSTATYNWTGNLTSYAKETITLPALDFNLQDVNTATVSIGSDDNNDNNSTTMTFDRAVNVVRNLILNLNTDQYASECRWNIKNSAGAIVAQGQGYANNSNNVIEINLPTDDCYTFNLIDTYGDGGRAVSLKDVNGTVIYYTSGNYGSGASTNFNAEGTMSVADLNSAQAHIYPNPTTGIFQVETKVNSKIEVFDVTGKIVYSTISKSNSNQINLSGNAKGVYLVKISDGKSVETKKLILK